MGATAAMLYGPDVPVDTAAWVKKVRKVNDLTQEQLGEMLGVSRETVGKWEARMYEPDFRNVKAIIDRFPEAAAWLAGNQAKGPAAPRLKSLEAREIAHVVDSLPVKSRVYVRDMVYRLVSGGRSRPRTT